MVVLFTPRTAKAECEVEERCSAESSLGVETFTPQKHRGCCEGGVIARFCADTEGESPSEVKATPTQNKENLENVFIEEIVY